MRNAVAQRRAASALIATNFFGRTRAIAARGTVRGVLGQDARNVRYAQTLRRRRNGTFPPSRPRTAAGRPLNARVAGVNSSASNACQKALLVVQTARRTRLSLPTPPSGRRVALFASTDNVANLECFRIDIIGAETTWARCVHHGGRDRRRSADRSASAHRYRGSWQCDCSFWPCRFDWLDVGAGELDSAIEQRRYVIAEARLSRVAGSAETARSGSGVPGMPGMRPPSRAALVVPRYGVLKDDATPPYAE